MTSSRTSARPGVSRTSRTPSASRIRGVRGAKARLDGIPLILHDARRPPPGRARRGDRLGADAGHEADLGAGARALPALRSRPRPGGARGPLGRRRRRSGARAPACRMGRRRAGAGGRDGGAGVRGAVAGARLSGLRPLTRHEVKLAALSAAPALLVAVACLGAVYWYRRRQDPIALGKALNQSAWESSFEERGLPVPPSGPR